MNAFWTYFWPPLGTGLLFGVIAGAFGFRPRARRMLFLLAGGAASIAAVALWHGPLGAADRFTAEVQRTARQTLDNYEMTQVRAQLHHGPLTRRLVLSGPADDFQSSELVRIMGDLPGVSVAQWSNRSSGVPLIAEGAAMAILGFLIGLLVAYLVELRRRYNAQWNW